MARLRRADVPCECPLIGVNRKWLADRQNDALDPKWPIREADIAQYGRHVSNVPGTDSCAAYSEDWFNRPYRVRVIQEIESKIGLDQNRLGRANA